MRRHAIQVFEAPLSAKRHAKRFAIRFTALLAWLSYGSASAIADPYSYYGGDVDAKAKNRAIEACEYERLVEDQACNASFNKTDCISKVHQECADRYAEPNSSVEQEKATDDDGQDESPRT